MGKNMPESGECFSLKENIFPKEEKFLNEWGKYVSKWRSGNIF
jgi:hypothetical protein